MRAYGLADTPPPSPGTLRELVALEGRDEPLPPGAYFPMEPTPVRDGRPLWEVEVRVITDDPDLWYRWQDVDELAHPRLEEVRGHGIGELPDGSDLLSTGLRIWATDGAEAQVIAGELIDDLVGAAETRRRLEVSPAYSDEYFELPRSPEDYESQLVAKRWQRAQASPAGVKIAWFTGPCPLERVDVRETPERVTITLWERYPPSFRPGGVMTAIAAIGITRCVEVPLQQPLATRVVIDGRTGTTPEDIDDFDYIERNTYEDLARADLDKFPCQPIPRLDRTP